MATPSGTTSPFTYADPRACPSCRGPLPEQPTRCPSCDVAVGHPIAVEVFTTLQQVDRLGAQLRAVSRAPVSAASAASTPWVPPIAPALQRSGDVLAPSPSPRGPRRTGVRGSSVPAILLGLGVLRLLVAAVIFLAVAWSWLGVGGRTTALVVLTAATAGGGLVLHARGLRLAGEALLTVSVGLLVLDVLGAESSGWFGDLSSAGTGTVVGLVLLGAGVGLTAADHRLAVPQLSLVLGLYVGQASLAAWADRPLVVAAIATATLVGLARGARSVGLTVLFVGASLAACLDWLQLVGAALISIDPDRVEVGGLLDVGTTPALVAASLLLLVPMAFGAGRDLQGLCLIGAGSALTATLALPVVDNGLTAVASTSLAAGVLWTAVAYAVPRAVVVTLVPAGLSLVPATGVALTLGGQALESFATATDDLRLDPRPTADPVLLVITALVLAGFAFAPATGTARRALAPIAALAVALAGIAVLALHPVPLWTVVGLLCVAGGAIAADGVRRPAGATGALEVVGGILVLALAAAGALPSTSLLLVPLVLLSTTTGATMLLARFGGATELGGMALPLFLGLTLTAASDVAGVGPSLAAVPVLLGLAVLALLRPRVELEASAAVVGLVAAAAGVGAAADQPTSLSLHLTLTGALLTLHAMLHATRRPVAWGGSVLLVLATWVRLVELGVDAPEPYTLPAAVGLLGVGLHRLHRDPAASTRSALLPGLLLATVPSFLEVLQTDPVSGRAVALGGTCLVLVVAGQWHRWSAPLLVGAAVGAALTLVELSPYAAQTPQWVAIGGAGSFLIAVGVTWERRVVELHRAAQYVGRLR